MLKCVGSGESPGGDFGAGFGKADDRKYGGKVGD